MNKEYIDIHSDALNGIKDVFWRNEIVNLLNKKIKKADIEEKHLLINNPYDRFIIHDDCFIFGYRSSLAELICLNDTIIIYELEANDILSAINCAVRLYHKYGCIIATYATLLEECNKKCN